MQKQPSAAQVVVQEEDEVELGGLARHGGQNLFRQGDDSVERYKDRLERQRAERDEKSYDNYSTMLNPSVQSSPRPADVISGGRITLGVGVASDTGLVNRPLAPAATPSAVPTAGASAPR